MEKEKSKYKLPKGWSSASVKDVTFYQKGKKPKKLESIRFEDSLPYLDIKAFEYKIISKYGDRQSSTIVDENDVVMVWDGARSGWVSKGMKGALGSTLAKLNPFIISQQYLYYYLNSQFLYINSNTKGTGIPHVDPMILWRLNMPIPPLKEQHRIVSKIEELSSELDHAEKGLQKAKQQLKVYRQALLKSAFEGKLTEQWRKENDIEPGEKLLEHIKTDRQKRYEKELVDWELAKEQWKRVGKKPEKPKEPYTAPLLTTRELNELTFIPEEWKWVKTSNVISVINNGYTPKSAFLSDINGEVPFIKVYNLTFRGVLDFSITPTFIPKEKHLTELKRSVCKPGDVLINIVGPPLGKVSIVPDLYNEWNINQAIVLFRPNEYISSKYISFFMQSSTTIQWLSNTSIGTAGQRNIKVSTCREIPIPLCSILEQNIIVKILESQFSINDNLEQTILSSLQKLNVLRQSILRKAFEGKLVSQEK
jgi:type I restriction enzyme S subunit